MSLNERIEALARDLARRESKHAEDIEKAHYKAHELPKFRIFIKHFGVRFDQETMVLNAIYPANCTND